MDTGVLLLIGGTGLVFLIACAEAIWRNSQRRQTLAQIFGGTAPKTSDSFDEDGMTPETRMALHKQMRITAQAGVQGLDRSAPKGWTLQNPAALQDPQAYARMFVPHRARHLETSPDAPQTVDASEKDAPK